MDRISRPKKTTMRSLASPMTIAPDAERSMRAWNSGPVAFSRRIHPSATSAESRAAHDTSTATKELKPSSTTAESMDTCAPWLATSNHCTSDSDSAASVVITAMTVATWASIRRRCSDEAARMATAPPSMTSTGRIDR